jgi:sugar lactone lactonase YvrE
MKKTYLLILLLSNLILNSQTWVDCQNANYVISGATLTAQGNGNWTPTDSTIKGNQSHFAIDPKHKFLYLADRDGNRVLRFTYPITKNQPKANLVYGQTAFNTSNGNTSANTLITPLGVAVDSISGTLWILDGGNNRVLRFDSAHKNTVNGPSANQVLGQFSFSSNSPGTSQTTFTIDIYSATGNLLYYDHATGNLWVGDNSNNRVLLFNNAKSLSNGAPASAVLGQPGYTTTSSACNSSRFGGLVSGVTMIGNSLFVCDRFNHRVLRFDNVYSKPNGAPADAVFGQTSFTTNAAGCSAIQMNIPVGITSDYSKLYITEQFNNRITIFNSALTNTIASNVLWANNVSSPGNNGATPSSGMLCESITMDPIYKQLLIADAQNKRIMVFNSGISSDIMNYKESSLNSVSLYPNPTSGIVTLKAKTGLPISVYNIMGELILNSELKTDTIELDLNNQANGIYIVRIGSVAKKIIKE